MTSPDDFDASRLRRLDRPHRPDEDADAAIKARMFDAFDKQAASDETDAPIVDTILRPAFDRTRDDQSGPGGDDVVVEIDLRGPDNDVSDRNGFWGYRLAVAAATIAIVGIGVLFAQRTPEEITPARGNSEVVVEFCETTVVDLVVIFDDYHGDPTGETQIRALRNLELLAQAYTDLADELEAPLSDVVRDTGALLLEQAATTRGALTILQTGGGEMADLIAAISDDIERLPGGSSCPTNELRGV